MTQDVDLELIDEAIVAERGHGIRSSTWYGLRLLLSIAKDIRTIRERLEALTGRFT